MKVRVDQEACVGDETCVEICPEVFEMQGDVAVAKMEEVPEGLEDAYREAAENFDKVPKYGEGRGGSYEEDLAG